MQIPFMKRSFILLLVLEQACEKNGTKVYHKLCILHLTAKKIGCFSLVTSFLDLNASYKVVDLTHLDKNMLHQVEWIMSTTPLEFLLLSVLLRNLLVHGMASLLIVHVPQFIHSCITLSFEVQIFSCLFHSVLKTQCYHLQAFEYIS